MARQSDVKRLNEGSKAWNAWRKERRRSPNLSRENFSNRDLAGYDLSNTNLSRCLLVDVQLRRANLTGANLSNAIARFASFSGANLEGADLSYADLRAGSLRRCNLKNADLEGAILRFTSLVEAKVDGAILSGAQIYGISAWDLKGEPADQSGMVIQARRDTIPTTIDDLDTAQFLFLFLDNPKIADVIDTASKRTVLLLGRFTPKRKKVLDAMKQRLLKRNFAPMLFDFAGPKARDLTETVASLAHMACFVIADLSGAKSIPQELSFIVPYLPSVPVIPLLSEDDRGYAMFEHFQRYPWVKPPVRYRDLNHLLRIFDNQVLKLGYTEAMRARGIKNPKLPALTKKPAKKKPARK